MSDAMPAIEAVEQQTLPPIRPAAGWYAVGGVVLLGGLLAAFLILTAGAFGYLRNIDDLDRIELPSDQATVELPAGESVVYHEPDGGPVLSLDVLALRIEPEVPMTASCCDDYAIEGRQGREVARVEVPRAGSYRITAEGSGGLALGAEPGRRLSTYGVAALVTAAAAVVGGVGILVGVRRARRRAQALRRADQARSGARAGGVDRNAR